MMIADEAAVRKGKYVRLFADLEANYMDLTFWDYITFLSLFTIAAGFTVVFILLLQLPGKIAIKRNHPHAEAVQLLGELGFLGGVSWLYALIWAIKEADAIDIRRFPSEEREAVREEIERLTAGARKKTAQKTAPPESEADNQE
jgi:hypothetical protein